MMAYFDQDILDNLEEVVDEAETALRTREVVERSESSKPTVLRYLKQLEKQGRISKKGTGTSLEWYTGEYLAPGERQ